MSSCPVLTRCMLKFSVNSAPECRPVVRTVTVCIMYSQDGAAFNASFNASGVCYSRSQLSGYSIENAIPQWERGETQPFATKLRVRSDRRRVGRQRLTDRQNWGRAQRVGNSYVRPFRRHLLLKLPLPCPPNVVLFLNITIF